LVQTFANILIFLPTKHLVSIYLCADFVCLYVFSTAKLSVVIVASQVILVLEICHSGDLKKYLKLNYDQ